MRFGKKSRKVKKVKKKCGRWQSDLDTKTGIGLDWNQTLKSPGNAGPTLASKQYNDKGDENFEEFQRVLDLSDNHEHPAKCPPAIYLT